MFVCMCVLVFSAHVEFLHNLTGSGDPEEHKHPLAPPTLPSHLGGRVRVGVCVCEREWVCGGVRNVGEEGHRKVRERDTLTVKHFMRTPIKNTDATNTSTSVTGL